MHLVHYASSYDNLTQALDKRGGIAVLATLFEYSLDPDEEVNDLIEDIKNIIGSPGEDEMVHNLSPRSFLPRNTANYYRYSGSLTTPDCNEGVIWTVFTSTLPISVDQAAYFHHLMGHDGEVDHNYRLTQALNSREVFLRTIPQIGGSGKLNWGFLFVFCSFVIRFL